MHTKSKAFAAMALAAVMAVSLLSSCETDVGQPDDSTVQTTTSQTETITEEQSADETQTELSEEETTTTKTETTTTEASSETEEISSEEETTVQSSETTAKSETTTTAAATTTTAAATTTTVKAETTTTAAQTTVTEAAAETKKPDAFPKPDGDPKGEIRDITAMQLVSEMRIGWNLGNTLDATGRGLASETAWGNPKTTKAMIDEVSKKGFNVLRIPTTWESHLGSGPDYTIDAAWLSRVQEVVDYAAANDMYIILNLHHEEWHYPTPENYDAASKELKAVWKQIAEHFEDYDEHLIFEGMNEPRVKGTPQEWNGGTKEQRAVLNKLNMDFVNTVRSTGGKNAKRCLMIPTYAANSGYSAVTELQLPENDDKIIVSVHSYSPYNFALNTKGTDKFSSKNDSDVREIDKAFETVYAYFVSEGVPVVMGEMGAVNKNNNEARVDWADCYITTAKKYGIPCVLWDNGGFTGDGENFGLLDRRTLKWKFPDVVDALIKASKKDVKPIYEE